MLAINGMLRDLGVRPDPAVIADFQRQAAEMKLWVRTNRLSVTSAPQRDILDRIEAALDDYVVRTTRIWIPVEISKVNLARCQLKGLALKLGYEITSYV